MSDKKKIAQELLRQFSQLQQLEARFPMLRHIFANANDAAEFEQVYANLSAQIAKAQNSKKEALDIKSYEIEPTGPDINGGAEMGGCQKLIDDLDLLRDDLDALEGKLVAFAIASIQKAAAIGMAYSTAYDNFNSRLNDMHKLNANAETISVSILSVLSVGAFSWVSNFSKTLTTIKDLGGVAVDKTVSYVFSGNAGLASSAKIIPPLFFYQLKIDEMLSVITETLNTCTRLKEKCTVDKKSLTNGCKNYATIYKFYMTDKNKEVIDNFYNQSTKEVEKASISSNTPIDKEKLIQDFEYALWVKWIPSLESIKTTYPKPHGMGPYSGGIPNYPMPGKKEKPKEIVVGAPTQTILYDGWLATSVRDRLRHFSIDKKAGVDLDFTLFGTRGVDSDEIKKLVKWALAQKITL